MDGLALLSKLKEFDVPIRALVVSAYGDMENIRIAMNRGAYDFLTKPIVFQDLETTLSKTIQDLALQKEALEAREALISLNRELDVAARIQQSILPQTFPPFPHRNDFDVFAAMHPARQVGGDFYDLFLIDEDQLGFVIGDVSDKGVPAAIYMAVCRSLLKATALQGLSPSKCLNHVNRLLCPDNHSGMFVTLFYAILDPVDGRVEYCGGGHNPPYLLRKNSAVEPLESKGGLVLGVSEQARYEDNTIKLQPGEGLFLYTDGVTEAMDAGRNLFSEYRLESFLQGVTQWRAKEIIHAVFEEVRNFTGGAAQHDDITALALRFLGKQTRG